MARASKFDWDDANTSHYCAARVTPEEVEQAFANRPLMVLAVQKRSGEERVLCAGLTSACRTLQLAYARRRGRIRVITAHPAKKNVRDKR